MGPKSSEMCRVLFGCQHACGSFPLAGENHLSHFFLSWQKNEKKRCKKYVTEVFLVFSAVQA